MKTKIAIYYDSLWVKGGAERVAVQLANALDADIYTSGLNPEITDWLGAKGKIFDIGNSLIKKNKGLGVLLEAPLRFALFKPSKHYDVHLFMGVASMFSVREEMNSIWFCFTPNRMLHDNKEFKRSTGSLARRIFFTFYQLVFTPLDQRLVKRFKKIIAQTATVQSRIKKFYKRDSEIIYSPIQVNKFLFRSLGDFFLTVGRLVPEKRIDLIAQAFTQLSSKKLVIVGDGPEKESIQKLISGNENIQLLTEVSDPELITLYSNCLATIYMPMQEDFGLIPLEGMASGKSCIAVNEGGCLETVQDGVTGSFIKPDQKSLMRAVRTFDVVWAKKQVRSCIESAYTFDIATCVFKWNEVIARSLNGRDED